MGDVLAFASFAEAVTFDGARENDGGTALVFDGGFIGGVDFARVVSAETQTAQRIVGEGFDELEKARIAAEEKLTNIIAGGDDEFLVFAVDDFAHALDEQAFGVALEDGIPLAPHRYFDDVPARAAESGFEFLNDLAIAADRTVEALKVAVDDEDEVVEFFAGGERDGAERFGLVGFAVAEESPDFGVGRWLEATIFEIAIEARLIDGHQRAQAHRDGGIFPEVRHEPGMRIRGEAAAGFQFAAKIFELLDAETAFEKSAGVDAGSGVALEIDGVAFEILSRGRGRSG